MAVTSQFLVDTSVVARMDKPDVAQRLDPLIHRGLVNLCDVVTLEIGHRATSIENYDQLREDFSNLSPGFPFLTTSSIGFRKFNGLWSRSAHTEKSGSQTSALPPPQPCIISPSSTTTTISS
jgi:hypothetical protein